MSACPDPRTIIEHLPVADGSVDAIISNCVINLSPDKPAVFREAFRALKPGGRAALQYIEIDDAIFESYRTDADFIQTYIFPGGMLISESRFRAAAEKAGAAPHTSARGAATPVATAESRKLPVAVLVRTPAAPAPASASEEEAAADDAPPSTAAVITRSGMAAAQARE